jgi:hypothetical protein
LLALLSLYFAWKGRWLATWAVFLIALSAHPTNVFLAPLLFLPQLWWFFDPKNRSLQRIWAMVALDALGCGAAYFLTVGQGGQSAGGQDSPIDFVRDLLRYLYGAPAFEYFTTAPSTLWMNIGDAVSAILGSCAVAGLVSVVRVDPHARRFIAGFVAMLLAVYFVGGSAVLHAPTSRYGLSVVVPCFFFAALGWDAFSNRLGWKPSWLALAAACAMLCAFFFGFVRAAELDGASAHPAYWTGSVEPKIAAYRQAAALIGDRGRIHVEDWWTYWPIRYMDGDHQPERIEWQQVNGEALARSIANGDVAIGFAGGNLDNQLKLFSRTLDRIAWRAPSGKETVVLWCSSGCAGAPGVQ